MKQGGDAGIFVVEIGGNLDFLLKSAESARFIGGGEGGEPGQGFAVLADDDGFSLGGLVDIPGKMGFRQLDVDHLHKSSLVWFKVKRG